MPRDFIDLTINRLKEDLKIYPITCGLIESFEKYAYDVYESEKEANMEDIKNPKYNTMQDYGAAMKAELGDNYRKLNLLMELIEAHHNIKA